MGEWDTAYGAVTVPPGSTDDLLIRSRAVTPPTPGTIQRISVAGLRSVQPTGDVTGVKDTLALNQAMTFGWQVGTGAFYANATLLLDTGQQLAGSGPGTVINAVSGFSGSSMVALKTPASSAQVTVRDLALVPAQASLIGIYLDNTGFGTADSRHRLLNVFVNSAGGDAFKFGANIRSMSVIGCQQYFSEGYGFNLQAGTTDNFLAECVSGGSVNHGFYVNDGNNTFTACKAFYAGHDTNLSSWGTTQAGFYLNAVSRTVLSGCTAEQCALNGIDLQSCSASTVTGCAVNNNSAGNAVTTGVGINLNANLNCSVVGNSGNNNGGISPGTQKYGVQVAGTQTGTYIIGNTFQGATGIFNYVSGGGYLYMGTDSMDLSGIGTGAVKVSALNLQAGSAQPLSNSSTITVPAAGGYIPVTETGNVTGIILQASFGGVQVTIVNRSNFTVTFAASGTSNVADGASDVIPALTSRIFQYDGGTSLWYRCA